MGEPVTRRPRAAGWIALAALVASVGLSACGGERSIIGEWSGEDAEGNRIGFVFQEGDVAEWVVQARGMANPDTIEMRYEVDRSVSPHHIDLDGFEQGPLEGVTMVGIYEFTAGDAFRIDLAPVVGAVDPDSARPKEFSEETVVFTRGGGR